LRSPHIQKPANISGGSIVLFTTATFALEAKWFWSSGVSSKSRHQLRTHPHLHGPLLRSRCERFRIVTRGGASRRWTRRRHNNKETTRVPRSAQSKLPAAASYARARRGGCCGGEAGQPLDGLSSASSTISCASGHARGLSSRVTNNASTSPAVSWSRSPSSSVTSSFDVPNTVVHCAC
jgi:hypothetical protein